MLRAEEYIHQLEKDFALMNKQSTHYGRLKSLSLNTKSLILRKSNEIEEAIKITDDAIRIELKYNVHPIERARTLLNKAIHISYLGQNNYSEDLKNY